jgi:hypothetical protein
VPACEALQFCTELGAPLADEIRAKLGPAGEDESAGA